MAKNHKTTRQDLSLIASVRKLSSDMSNQELARALSYALHADRREAVIPLMRDVVAQERKLEGTTGTPAARKRRTKRTQKTRRKAQRRAGAGKGKKVSTARAKARTRPAQPAAVAKTAPATAVTQPDI